MSVKQIAARLDASQASVSVWIRGIALTEKQRSELRKGPIRPEIIEKRKETRRAPRRRAMEAGKKEAETASPEFLVGVALFWAEGSRDRNTVEFANSDPAMIRLFARFLTEQLGVPREKIKLRVFCYSDNGLSVSEIERYWLDVCGLDRSALQKTMVDNISRASKRKGRRLAYGVAHLRVSSTQLSMRLHGAIQTLGGVERPEWRDMKSGDEITPLKT